MRTDQTPLPSSGEEPTSRRAARIETEIVIDAAPDAVWTVLTDFTRYGEWNPFVVEAKGAAYVGTRLDLTVRVIGKSKVTAEVTQADGRTLEWSGVLGKPGIFDARHRFDLIACDAGTRLVHSETFTGWLHRPLLAMIGRRTALAFEAMNRALAERVTAQAESTTR